MPTACGDLDEGKDAVVIVFLIIAAMLIEASALVLAIVCFRRHDATAGYGLMLFASAFPLPVVIDQHSPLYGVLPANAVNGVEFVCLTGFLLVCGLAGLSIVLRRRK